MGVVSWSPGSNGTTAELGRRLKSLVLAEAGRLPENTAPEDRLRRALESVFECAIAEASERELESLAEIYPRTLCWTLAEQGGQETIRTSRSARKGRGAYYTPRRVARELVAFAVEPWLEREQPMRVTVCDPTCGAGELLLEAGEAIAAAAAEQGLCKAEVRREVALRCLFGVDVDPVAVSLCKARVRRWASLSDSEPLPNIQLGDSIEESFPWQSAFPSVFRSGGFHAVLANPPFGNVVEGWVRKALRDARKRRFPSIGGTADLAYYFTALSCLLIRIGGRVAIIQPRAFASADSAIKLRQGAGGSEMTWMKPVPFRDMFSDATVSICLVGFERRAPTLSNAQPSLLLESDTGRFSVRASLTVREAYDLRAHLVDRQQGSSPKLLTTGLIDPRESRWGRSSCRFLKRAYQFPRVAESARGDQRLARRLEAAARPKLLVGGLGNKIEALLDERGEFIGAVSTYTVTHEDDDLAELAELLEHLLSPNLTLLLHQELGAAALGGGYTTITKRFLRCVVGQFLGKHGAACRN